MKLQTKLAIIFGLLAGLTFGVSFLGYWQVKKFGAALYEVGVVRLPSIEGLNMIEEARTTLGDFRRLALLTNIDDAAFAAELEQQKQAWAFLDKGWRLYEPLPQTEAEARYWKEFVPAAKTWKTNYEAMISLVVESRKTGDKSLLAKAAEESQSVVSKQGAGVGVLVSNITALNYQVADDAMQHSVDSYQAMIRAQNLMLFAVAASVLGAIGCGVFIRLGICRPIVQMAGAFFKIGQSDYNAHVPVQSHDEIGRLALAFNDMVEKLRWRTAFLDAQVNSSIDGVLVVDSQGRKLLQNKRMVEMWKIPPRIADDSNAAGQIEFVAGQVKTPKPFIDKIKYLYAYPNETSRDEIELEDGRVFDRYSSPVLDKDQKNYGRIWTFRDITAHKQSENALRQSESQLRLVIDTFPVMAWITRPDGIVDFLNQRWLDFTGLSLEQFIQTPTGPIHPEDIPRALDNWRARMADGQPYEDEMRLRRADGEYRWFLVRTAPLRDEHGKILKWFGTSTDIEDRKRVEAELLENQRLLHLVVATLPVGVAVMNQAGDVVLDNDASKRIWGSPRIIAGRERWVRSKGFWHDSGEPILPENWASARALSQGQTSLDELLDIEAFDGQRRTIKNSATPIRTAEGLIVGAVIVNEDVTEWVRAKEALQKQAQEIKAIVENSPDLIVRFDRDLRRIYVNPAAIRLLGCPEEALLGKTIGSSGKDGSLRATTQEIAILEASLQRAFDTGRPLDLESTWPTPVGRRIFIIRLEPELDARGGLTGILTIGRDITEVKESEAKLRQAEAELARVARLTVMGELTASIAHEVNQPLAAVVTNANAVARWLAAVPPNLDEAREALGRIDREGRRASEVIQRIRALFKKGEPVRTPVNLNQLIQETVSLTKAELVQNEVSLQTYLPPELPLVAADHVQLQQVLLNLILNAIDSLGAVSDRPRVLSIQTGRPGPEVVQVTVQDNGLGIGSEEAKRLFQSFYTTKPDGLGMGLMLSRSIVEAHGGHLWATPNEGPGVTFQFTLPVQNGDAL